MITLYNLHTDGDQYRITKFVDSNPESSYLLSHQECQCPAGHRATCRHRQMLPEMLMHNLVDTHWFWNYEQRMATDFEGSQVALYETVAEGPLAEEDCTGHIASAHDSKICGICGVHIDSLRPPEDTEQDTLPAPTPKQSWRRI